MQGVLTFLTRILQPSLGAQNPKERGSGKGTAKLYQHPGISACIKAAFFSNRNDLGIKYWSYFKEMPNETLAFVINTVKQTSFLER